MNILIAPDSFKESCSALAVAQHIENGFRKIYPDATYIKVPMADGGEGTVQSLIDALNGELHFLDVIAPLGNQTQAFIGVTKRTAHHPAVAILEMAAASGLHLVPEAQRDPRKTTSFGTGQLILAALDLNVDKIIIGIGGSATNDGGVGMMQALGAHFLDNNGQELAYGGSSLAQLATIDLTHLDPRLKQVEIEVACDVDNPLCGKQGASATFGPQKGASAAMVLELDQSLAHYANIIESQLGRSVADIPGSGAAGGTGAAFLALLEATLKPGITIVCDVVKLDEKIAMADLVITGEGRIDSQTIHGKTPIGVARIAKRYHKPVIGIAGALTDDCGVVHEHGLDAVFSVVNGACTLSDALKQAGTNIELTARNIAALYKLGQNSK